MKDDLFAEVNRRDFLRGGSAATVMMLMGGIPILAAEEEKKDAPADDTTNYKGEATPVNVGVIGCGPWGREIIKTLSLIPHGPVVAVCDNYAAMVKRAATLAPEAARYDDYQQLLADPKVQAVVVATPSHLHKEIVLAAFKAGKHVYCEAPMATTFEDAAAIARAAREQLKLNFQVGLQNRADKQIVNLGTFIRTGVLGKALKAQHQFHKKQSWRLPSPNPDREKALNWRLDKALSLGLAGELGIHQIDVTNWFFNSLPLAVTGFGSLVQWKDEREVPDNVHALIEYPGGAFLNYEATLGNSFESEMGTFYGTDCAIMIRERRAWMFKEADAPLLGWEVYAKKDAFYKDSGIVLGAGNTNQKAQMKATEGDAVDETTALQYALDHFLINSYSLQSGVEDFIATYGADDKKALDEFLAELAKTRLAAPGWKEGFESAVTVIKTNEAVQKGQRIAFQKEWFELA